MEAPPGPSPVPTISVSQLTFCLFGERVCFLSSSEALSTTLLCIWTPKAVPPSGTFQKGAEEVRGLFVMSTNPATLQQVHF